MSYFTGALFMPIKIRCACGNILLAPEERLGQIGKCPGCDLSIPVELPKLKNEEIPSKSQSIKTTAKFSFLCKFLSLGIYLVFFLLLACFLALHLVDKPPFPNQYKEPLLMIKNIQHHWYKNFLRKFTKIPTNAEI